MWSNSCISSIFFFSTLVLSILHFSTSHTLITDICYNVSIYTSQPNVPYDFCTRSLLDARGDHPATLEGLGMIAMNITAKNWTDTFNYIKELLNDKNLDKDARSDLEECFKSYRSALGYLDSATAPYKHKNFGDAAIVSDLAECDVQGCEEEINYLEGFAPLKVRNTVGLRLSTIAVHIMGSLRDGKSN